jgi:putative tryptophan/tyrosine transport system substrate-binding protein
MLCYGANFEPQGLRMRRREFIARLGAAGAYAAVPRLARAQQGTRMRRIGVLIEWAEADPQAKAGLSAFVSGLSEWGWTAGGNVRMDVRFGSGNTDRIRAVAKELIDLQPEAILASSTPATAALHRLTRTIPIVFVQVSDPIGSGFVNGLPHPGANITGFMIFEPSTAGKWLELLTMLVPNVSHAAAMFNPDTAPYVYSYYFPAFETAARSLKIEPIAAPVHSDAEIEAVIELLARRPESGLVTMPDAFTFAHRHFTISAATRAKVPAMWGGAGQAARDGGLLSYGPDVLDVYRRAATYVDRILRGANPADLPVQFPEKFVMALNLRAAATLGLTIPPNLLATADEVIE